MERPVPEDATKETSPLLSVEDYRLRAQELLPRGMYNTLFGEDGARDWEANTNNVDGFAQFALRPRVMVDVSDRRLETTALGFPISMPVMIAPSGHQQRVHPDRELATAPAA